MKSSKVQTLKELPSVRKENERRKSLKGDDSDNSPKESNTVPRAFLAVDVPIKLKPRPSNAKTDSANNSKNPSPHVSAILNEPENGPNPKSFMEKLESVKKSKDAEFFSTPTSDLDSYHATKLKPRPRNSASVSNSKANSAANSRNPATDVSSAFIESGKSKNGLNSNRNIDNADEYSSMPINLKTAPKLNWKEHMQTILSLSKDVESNDIKKSGMQMIVTEVTNNRKVLPAGMMQKFEERENMINAAQEAHAKLLNYRRESIIEETSDVAYVAKEITQKNVDKAKSRWKLALNYTIASLRFIALHHGFLKKQWYKSLAPMKDSDGLAFLLNSQQTLEDPNLTAKVKELTSKKERSEADLASLERLLSIRIRAFSRFSLDQRLKFCNILKYEQYDGVHTIVREGHVSWAFYFIMSGQVEIFKIKDGMKFRLNVMNAGASFGDRTMNLMNDLRTACVGSTMNIELIRVDKSDYFDIVNVRDEKGMANRTSKIMKIPHFASSEGGFVEKISPFCQVVTFEPNETIIMESATNFKIFWVLKGTCHAVKVVPFVKRVTSETYTSKTVKVVAHVPGMSLEPGDDVYKEVLVISELEFGDSFPEMPAPAYSADTEYSEQIRNEDPTDNRIYSYTSIIAKTKVEVVVVNRVDYVQFASPELIIELINQGSKFKIPISKLQETYLEQRNWQMHKKKIISEVRGNKK